MDKQKQAEYARLSTKKRSENARRKYDEAPAFCAQCESKLPFEKKRYKFCNHSCAASHTNRGAPRHGLKKTEIECVNCKKLTFNPKYCSNKCQGNYTVTNTIDKWLSGEGSSWNSDCVPNTIKDYLRKKFDDKCVLCGWSEVNPVTMKVPLQADHIDGNWKNNKEENLRLLCPNCHSLTPNFGATNKGNGRDLNGGRRSRKTNI